MKDKIKYIIIGYVLALLTSCATEPLNADYGQIGTRFNPMYVVIVDE